MNTSKSLLCKLLLSTALSATVLHSASAGGFAVREQSTTSLGMAFAGVAANGSTLSNIYWNPAVITQSEGFTQESHFAGILGDSEITAEQANFVTDFGDIPISGSSSSGNIAQGAIVPASYGAMQINEQLFVGIGINAPFGLVTNPDDDFVGRFHAQTSDLFTLNFNPVIGYKISDVFSIAIGAQIQYIDVRLANSVPTGLIARGLEAAGGLPSGALPVATTAEGFANLEADDWGVGATAGITITPFEGTTIGIGYRSPISHTVSGSGTIEGGSATTLGVSNLGSFSGELTLPETVTVGITHQLTDATKLLAGVEWTNWSRFEDLTIDFDDAPTGITDPNVTAQNYEDGWYFSAGLEHQFNDQFTGRAGIAYEISPVQDEYRTPRLTDADRLWLSLGGTYQLNDWVKLDAAYTYVHIDDGPINLEGTGENSGRGTLIAEADSNVHIFGIAARFEWHKREGGHPLSGIFN